MGINCDVYEAAMNGDFKTMKDLHDKGANINCILMGASTGRDNAKTPEEKRRFEKVVNSALEKGACFIFSFQHRESVVYGKPNPSA